MNNWWTRQQLKFRNPEARRKAVEKLALKETDETLNHLSAVADDPDLDVRLAVVKALSQLRNPEVVHPLINALRDPEPAIRELAVSALERLGNPICANALLPLINDRNLAVRRRAAHALGVFKVRPKHDVEAAQWAVALGEFSRAAMMGPAAIDALVAVVQENGSPERRQAVEALGHIEDARIISPIMVALKDSDAHVRVAAIEALERVKSPKAIEPLAGLLQDRDPIVRSAAINTLGRLPVGAAIERIAAALVDSHWSVRKSAIEALARAKVPEAVPALAGLLNDPDQDVREAAIEALAKIQDPSVVEVLVLKLADPQISVRQTAEGALGRIDPGWMNSGGALRARPALSALQADKDYWVRQAATEVLVRINNALISQPARAKAEPPAASRPNTALDELLAASQAGDRETRQAAVEALGGERDARAVEALHRALNDTDVWVRKAAARGLQITDGQAEASETRMSW